MILFMVYFFTTLVSIISYIMLVNACSFKKIGYMPFDGNRKFVPIINYQTISCLFLAIVTLIKCIN